MGRKPPSAGDSPFAALAGLRDKLAPQRPELRREDFPDPAAGAQAPARARVRSEQRDAKTSTVVEELGLPPAELERWRLILQRGLAASGTLEGETLRFDGDHRHRLPDLLLRLGVKRVVHGEG